MIRLGMKTGKIAAGGRLRVLLIADAAGVPFASTSAAVLLRPPRHRGLLDFTGSLPYNESVALLGSLCVGAVVIRRAWLADNLP